MERNRRIAKAYARKHTININGSCQDYLDGTTLGLNSFVNPDRDSKTSYIKQYIGEGVKIKIHESGDILVKRLSRSNVYLHSSRPDGAARRQAQPQSQPQPQLQLELKKSQSSSDVYALDGSTEFYGIVGPRQLGDLKHSLAAAAANGRRKYPHAQLPLASSSTSSGASSSQSRGRRQREQWTPPTPAKAGGIQLQPEKVCRIFSMARFKQALAYESSRAIPDRSRLQNMCICVLSFVANDEKKLNLPAWVMVINIVALDLMSSEIGLAEPYDSLGPPASTQVPRSQVSDSHNRSSDCLSSGGGGGQLDDEIEPYRKFEGDFSSSASCAKGNRFPLRSENSGRDLAAAAAAAHDYARPKFVSSENFYDINGGEDNIRALNFKVPDGMGASNEVNSDCEVPKGAHQQVRGPTNAVEQLGSSSSSGFNSQHSSYQHDSTSSSSSSSSSSKSKEQEPKLTGERLEPLGQPEKQRSRFRQIIFGHAPEGDSQERKRKKNIPSEANKERPPPTAVSMKGALAAARGKRPPKLPHGIAGQRQLKTSEFTSNEQEASKKFVMISRPIPIPAPPTSAGVSSGKANLILVSPTGLSPPTSKKLAPDLRAPIEGRPENQQEAQLPSGIPSHAQLAPPAARKHILRYLMSQTRRERPAAATPPLPPLRRYAGGGGGLNRPLPGLPKGHERRSDESLYYSGLQARVPNRQPNHLLPPGHNKEAAARAALFLRQQQQQHHHHQHHHNHRLNATTQAPHITKSAINAILSDIKHNAQFKQQLQQQLVANQIKRQHQQRRREDKKEEEEEADKLLGCYLEARRDCQTVERQLKCELFEESSNLKISSKFGMRSLESLNRPGGNQKPLSALLNHVGGFLKRSPKSSAKRP